MTEPAKIVFCGLPRSGKTSIHKVVLGKTPPHETNYLDSTHKSEMKVYHQTSLVTLNVCDMPGAAFLHPDRDDGGVDQITKWGALIFVLDAQDEPFNEALQHARRVIKKVYTASPQTCFELFIHKMDGDEFSAADIQADIHRNLMEDLFNDGVDAYVNFHSTSIYDHSIYEAMSKVIQKLMPDLPFLEQLMDMVVSSCKMEKAFLFDVHSKLILATDCAAVDGKTYELCSDMIDVVIDVSCIYGLGSEDEGESPQGMGCIIQLTTGNVLYLKQVEKHLAFACVLRDENFDRQYLIDYNIDVFKDSLKLLHQKREAEAVMIKVE